MAHISKQMSDNSPKTREQKHSFGHDLDEDLGNDFLSSWKSSKSVAKAAFDFEDDSTPKNRKSSFALNKLDMDFDFDSSLKALSTFDVDMSDLEFPSSMKPRKKKFSNQEDNADDNAKQEDNSTKFSFNFNGFDDLDLDDTLLKKSKKLEKPINSMKGNTDSSLPFHGSHHLQGTLLDEFKDDTSESNSYIQAATSKNKLSDATKQEIQSNASERLCSAGDDIQGQASIDSEPYSPTKRKDDNVKFSLTDKTLKCHGVEEIQETPVPLLVGDKGSEPTGIQIRPIQKSKSQKNPLMPEAVEDTCTTTTATDPSFLENRIVKSLKFLSSPDGRRENKIQESPFELSVEWGKGIQKQTTDGIISAEVASKVSKDEAHGQAFGTATVTELASGLKGENFNKEAVNNAMELDGKSETSKDTSRSEEDVELCKKLTTSLPEELSKDGQSKQLNNPMVRLESRKLLDGENNGDSREELIKASQTFPKGKRFGELKKLSKATDTEVSKSQEEAGSFAKSNKFFQASVHQDNIIGGARAVLDRKSREIMPEKSVKRKLSGLSRTPESPCSIMKDSKEIEADEVSTKTEMLDTLECTRSKKRCDEKRFLTGIHYLSKAAATDLLKPKPTSVPPEGALEAGSYLNKTTKSSTFQISRSLISKHEPQIKCQEKQISLPKLKPSIGSLCDQRKRSIPGGLQKLTLTPILPQKQNFSQNSAEIKSTRNLLNMHLPTKNSDIAEKQYQAPTLHKGSGLPLLGRNKTTVLLRESCEKAYNVDAECKGTNSLYTPQSNRVTEKCQDPVEMCRELLPTPTKENPDSVVSAIKSMGDIPHQQSRNSMQDKDDSTFIDETMADNNDIVEKSESYARHLEDLCKILKQKYEEAMDLRVRALVVNNTFLMLSNPSDDEKISFSYKLVDLNKRVKN